MDTFMRYHGKLVEWNDKKGFGFIDTHDSKHRVFVHISAFRNRNGRPGLNDAISFGIGKDSAGRQCAINATIAGASKRPATTGNVKFPVALGALFIASVTVLSFNGFFPLIIPAAYLGMSFLAFLVYAIDKSSARNNGWRIPENMLHLIDLAGGWPGGLIAQQGLRHKNRKSGFRLVYWITVIANIFGLHWLVTSGMLDHFNSLILPFE